MKTLIAAATLAALAAPALAQDPGRNNDTPGIDQGTNLGEVTKDSISTSGGRAHGAHASDPYGTGPNSGRSGLANIGNDLSDTIDAIDGD